MSSVESSVIYLGLDVHKDSVTIAVLPDAAVAPTRVERLPNDLAKLRRFCERLRREGEVRACYEASGAGYVLQRAFTSWGVACEVIAPSLIPTKPGHQRKHDKHDAAQLARLYRAGELTVVRIPSEAEERVRDVVRCRETFQREVLKSRHYILKFLARRGFVYRDGTPWRQAHYEWLRRLARSDSPLAPEDRQVFGEYLGLLEYKLSRRDELDRQIADLALTPAVAEACGGGRAAATVFPRVASPWRDGARHRVGRLAPLRESAAADGVPGARAPRAFVRRSRATRITDEGREQPLSARARAGRVGVSISAEGRRRPQGPPARAVSGRDCASVESAAPAPHPLPASRVSHQAANRRGRRDP